jgi:hypothetical protein
MGRRLWLTLASSSLLLVLAGCQGLSGDNSGPSGTLNQCTPQVVRPLVERFIDAFNQGDLARLDQLLAIDRFVAYSTDAPGQRLNADAYSRDTLMAYLSARHRQHEHLLLNTLDVTYTDARGGGFWFRVTRSAEDGLPPTAYNGKGGFQCTTMPISVTLWAMDPLPWSPIDLLPEIAALLLVAAAIGIIVLWRRRKTSRMTNS